MLESDKAAELARIREEQAENFQKQRVTELADAVREISLEWADFTSDFYDYFTGSNYVEKIESLQRKVKLLNEKVTIMSEDAPVLIENIHTCHQILQKMLDELSYGSEYNKKNIIEFNNYFSDVQKIVYAKKDSQVDLSEVPILPDEIVEQIYISQLRTCKTNEEAKSFAMNFRAISQQYKAITERSILKTFLRGFSDADYLNKSIVNYFYTKEISLNDFEFLLSHPNANPNISVVVDKYTANGFKYIWSEESLQMAQDRYRGVGSHYDIQSTTQALPLFFVAILKNDLAALAVLEKMGADLSRMTREASQAETSYGRSVLIYYVLDRVGMIANQQALMTGHSEMLQHFFPDDIIDKPLFNHLTPLAYAIENRAPPATVSWLIQNGAHLPAHVDIWDCAFDGYYDVVRALIENGFDINSENKYGESLFYVFVRNYQISHALSLLNLGAKINLTNTGEPLAQAIQIGNKVFFDTCLQHYFSQHPDLEEYEKKTITRGLLIQALAEPERNCFSELERSFMGPAQREGSKSILKELFVYSGLSASGADLSDLCTLIPLVRNEMALEFIIEQGFETYTNEENNFLHLVAKNPTAFLFLLGNLSSHPKKDWYLQLLQERNGENLTPVDILFQEIDNLTMAKKAINCLSDIAMFLDNKPEFLDRVDSSERTFLHHLLDKPHFKVNVSDHNHNSYFYQDYLFHERIDYPDIHGLTPLHYLAMRIGSSEEDMKSFKEIITLCKPNLSYSNQQGETILHLAVKNKNERLVAYLLSLAMDISKRDHAGMRAIDYAVGNESLLSQFKMITDQDLSDSEKRYLNYKGTFFSRLAPTKESDHLLEQLKQERDKNKRYDLAQEYITHHPSHELSKELSEFIPSLRRGSR